MLSVFMIMFIVICLILTESTFFFAQVQTSRSRRRR